MHRVWNSQVGGALDALRERENERQDETQFSTKIDGFLNFSAPPPLNANVLFLAEGSGAAVLSLLYG
jgi:hypothetical protein